MDSQPPKVSVILTSYNRPRLVAQAIESVLNQTFQDFELILGDDNSGPETRRVLENYFKNPKIIYLQTGVAKGNRYKTCRYATVINLALKIARGEFVTYLCDDDIYYPRRLEVMVKTLEENPDYFIVYGSQQLRWLSGTVIPLKKIRRTCGVLWQAAGKVDHNSIMHRRVCLDKVGFWEDQPANWHSADAVFFNKLNRFWPFYPIDEVLDEHRFHSSSVQSKKLLILLKVFWNNIKKKLGRWN